MIAGSTPCIASTLAAEGVLVSHHHLPEQGANDEPVKRHDGCEIDPAEQVVRPHQRGRGDVLSLAGGRDIHHDAKIQVLVIEASDEPVRRFADDGKYPNAIDGFGLSMHRRLQAERCHHMIAQGQQVFDPAGPARQHSLGRPACVKRGAFDGDAKRIAELRAGQKRAGVDVGFDGVDLHSR